MEVDLRRVEATAVWVTARDGLEHPGVLTAWLFDPADGFWRGVVTYTVGIGSRHYGSVPQARLRPRAWGETQPGPATPAE